MKSTFGTLIVGVALLVVGCASSIDKAADHHEVVAPMMQLGLSEGAFLALTEPSRDLSRKYSKPPTRHSRSGEVYTVYYIRSARIRDGEITDDEFTPYIFRDGKLDAIGWQAIGGPRVTSGDIAKARASATTVKVKQVNNNKGSAGSCKGSSIECAFVCRSQGGTAMC